MGKIVKYCAACDESFAEKFGFCPNCGQQMTAFEMNPLKSETQPAAINNNTPEADDILEIPPVETASAPIAESSQQVADAEISNAAEPIVSPVEVQSPEAIDDAVIEDEAPAAVEEFTAPETKTFAAAASAGASINQNRMSPENFQSNAGGDGGYRVTVIEEKGVKERNLILLGSLLLMTGLALGGLVYNLFTHNLYVNSIDQDSPLYVAEVDAPPPIEEDKPQPKTKNEGGGGGGGGKENPQDVNKGRLPDQVKTPIMPPQPLPQVTNASLPNPNQTQGNIRRPPTNEPIGLPSGLSADLSSGSGSGGGVGRGNGTGVGGGNGTGEGNGNGSGSGNGNGNGNGNGSGTGNDRLPPPPPPVIPAGPSEPVKILSRPQPKYTDAARQNQVQGTVTVKVTFMANGTIGSISPVSGLPYGLTEQAIAAARSIRFEPAKKGGVPYSVTKTVAYTFTIY